MSFSWFVRATFSVLLLALSTTALGFSTHTDAWSEETLLHDGRTMKVNREVYWTFHWLSGDEASLQVMESYPDKYWFKFIDPDTNETIKWQGDEDYSPVLIDILNGVLYLVVQGPQDQETKTRYLCPEVPYFFYKYKRGWFGKWIPISPQQFPDILKNANLSPTVPDDIEDYYKTYRGDAPSQIPRPKRSLSHADVLANIKNDEMRSGGQLRSIIPHKCPVWVKPSPIVLPAATKVRLEILESKEYSPEKSFDPGILFDKKKTVDCVSLIKPEDPRNPLLTGRYVFVKDNSRLNKIQFNPAASPTFNMVCDGENVWFPSYANKGVIELTKRSNSGDLIYRVTFQSPYPAYMILSSVQSRGGYLYFNLWDSQNDAQGGHLKRALKVRFLEPQDKRINTVKAIQ